MIKPTGKMNDELKQVALNYTKAGLSIIPVGADKLPMLPSWKKYQTEAPTEIEVENWFNSKDIKSLALVTGNGITVLDFDKVSFYDKFIEIANGQTEDLPLQQSGKGYHIAFKSDLKMGNRKLAWYPDITAKQGKSVGIETKGNGGYILIAPSLHAATGKHYKSLVGSFDKIPTISSERAQELIDLAVSLDETSVPKTVNMSKTDTDLPMLDRRIIEAFNNKHPLHELLTKHGYTKKPDGKYLGPDSTSGNPGVLVSEKDGKQVCISFHADLLNDDEKQLPHDAFDVFRLLEHKGKFRNAIKAANEELGISKLLMPTLIEFDLLQADLPEPQFVIPGFVPEGLSILAGKPKVGKSWLGLEMCIAVAEGTQVLGKEVEQGGALYFGLEDSAVRLKSRLHKLLPDAVKQPELLKIGQAAALERLYHGGTDQLNNYLAENKHIRLVVIDTLAKVKPETKNSNTYDEDSAIMGKLQQIAIEHGIALVLVHHVRKAEAEDVFDMISGSMGLQGVADAMLVLNKRRGGVQAELSVTGRDLKDDLNLAVSFDKDTAKWNVMGDAYDFNITTERQKILDVLEKSKEAMTPTEIAGCLDGSPDNIKSLLSKMKFDGQVDKEGRGQYKLATFKMVVT